MGLGRADCFKIWERGRSSKKTERFEAGDLERGGGHQELHRYIHPTDKKSCSGLFCK